MSKPLSPEDVARGPLGRFLLALVWTETYLLVLQVIFYYASR